MPKAVRYDGFGGIDVLRVEEVPRPVPGDGQVLVRVKAAGINPSEAVIRMGAVADLFPLAQVREAYTELERRHTRGKIVLRP
ncbi:hypothetical protein [Kribbella kalugense]|uniref:Zinc-binding alcohol dehydrogenase family protein n=1 Tax=Kribbella kalugense TaxID=2512221 RepID=A0A4R7ZXZ5_9ACTN|nr:hypothetical protein [Kribbella kalugense]TDW22041.1 hypothetical protein EV650_0873 [Kribbella kalugense]